MTGEGAGSLRTRPLLLETLDTLLDKRHRGFVIAVPERAKLSSLLFIILHEKFRDFVQEPRPQVVELVHPLVLMTVSDNRKQTVVALSLIHI